MVNYSSFTPKEVRKLCREGYVGPTTGFANGYVQANLLSVPSEYASDVLLFSHRNPISCPLLDVIEAGNTSSKMFQGDIRTDLPGYKVYIDGVSSDGVKTDIREFWRNDLVSFLFGCSFSFETKLMQCGIEIHHINANKNVPMYISNIKCAETKNLHGHMVVSMRSIPSNKVALACNVTSHFIKTHGAPIHIGNPHLIGIYDIEKPNFGDKPIILNDEIPVFWGCGVTPQIAVLESKIPFAISHHPGMMAVMDIQDEDIMNW